MQKRRQSGERIPGSVDPKKRAPIVTRKKSPTAGTSGSATDRVADVPASADIGSDRAVLLRQHVENAAGG
jgi:hypothetical protein